MPQQFPEDAVVRTDNAAPRPHPGTSSAGGPTDLETPTFLICSERSGSNLLRAILDAHSKIHAPMPLHLGRDVWANLYKYGDLTRDDNWRALLDDVATRVQLVWRDKDSQLTADQLLDAIDTRHFKDVYKFVYWKAMKSAGKSRVFIKENHTHRQAYFLLEQFTEPKFVYQIRDPRDYVLSCKRVSRFVPHYGSISGAIRVWNDDQRGALNIVYALPASRTFMLRYEDLLADPESVLAAVCQFLAVPFEAAMLRFHERPAARHAARSNPSYWKNLARPLLRKNIQKYRSGLRRIEIRTIEFRLGELMQQLGYKSDMAPPGVFRRIMIVAFELLGSLKSKLVTPIRRRKDNKAGWSLAGHQSERTRAITYRYSRRSKGSTIQK